MNLHRTPQLVMTPTAWRKMLTYVQLCAHEINGWAYVEQLNDSMFYIRDEDDVFITDQTVTSGTAVVHDATAAFALDRAMRAGRAEELRLQWHSHVKGSTVFSKTDTDTMDRFGEGGATWMISLVLNKFGSVTGRLDLYAPVRVSIDLPINIEQPLPVDMVAQCRADMQEHVSVEHSEMVRGKKDTKARRVSWVKPIQPAEFTSQDTLAYPISIG